MGSYPPLPAPPPGADPEPVGEQDREAPEGSAAKVLVAAGVLVVVLGALLAGYAWLRTPGRCEASTVESTRFGYCLAAPGWEYTNERSSSTLPYDELVHPADASSVRILAVPVEAGGRLADVIAAIRQGTVEEGAAPGAVTDTTVAGVPAARWDSTLDTGGVELRIREVVFVRDGTAWRVQLAADPERFDARLSDFERILGSWTFR
jgi:hypothetical protein